MSENIHQALLSVRHKTELAYAKLQNAQAYVTIHKIQLAIEKHWEIGDENYRQYQEEAVLVDYQEAFDKLEQLVVQRLFELAKLGISGTGVSEILYLQYMMLNFTTKGKNYALRLARHCSTGLKQPELPLSSTTFKWPNSAHHDQC